MVIEFRLKYGIKEYHMNELQMSGWVKVGLNSKLIMRFEILPS